MSALIAFEDSNNQVLRLSSLSQNLVYLVHRLDTHRFDFFESLEPLKEEEIPYEVVQELDTNKWSESIAVASGVTARVVSQEELGLLSFPKENWANNEEKTSKIPSRIMMGMMVLLFGYGIGTQILTSSVEEPQEVAEEEPDIEQKRRVRVQPRSRVTAANTNRKVSPKQARPKTSAVLGVLGSLSKGTQKGGIDLGKTNVSAGVGLGGSQGSGGAQKSLYAKGLSNAALGDGSNIKGGGGYGTKGAGGGQAGYGSESLVGSGGTSLTPLSHEATVDSGLDREMIANVVRRHMGQIRYCYEQALQGNPSLQGRVTAKWVVGASGKTSRVGIRDTSMHSKTVENCIKKHIRGWVFPLPRGGVSVPVSYPFLLKRTGHG